jgi:urate oxidase
MKELAVQIMLTGAFDRCYIEGDNSAIIATDTMKNTVYALAKSHPIDAIEDFALHLAEHFLARNAHVSGANVTIEQTLWDRITTSGEPHPHAFVGGSRETRTCAVNLTRSERAIESGIANLLVLKTTDSAFAGFLRDEFTTLNETDDRIFATAVTGRWTYTAQSSNWNEVYDTIRAALLETFAEHHSLSVQQTLFAMGEAALARCRDISEIHLTMPNQHRLLVDLAPFGMHNHNEIFVPTSEPFGLITGTIRRD